MPKTRTKVRQGLQSDKGANVDSSKMDDSNLFSVAGELVVDVFETPTDFVVVSAIAGVQIKDLDISLEKEMMVIQGQRVAPEYEGEKKYFYQECYWGPFSRKIVLPQNLDIAAADAQMDKGLLTITIPRLDHKSVKDYTDNADEDVKEEESL